MDPSGEWCNCREKLDAIVASDATDLEKLVRAFGGLTAFIIKDSERQVELSRASQDAGEAVKQQIKLETIKHARGLFDMCCRHITGKGAWDEEE